MKLVYETDTTVRGRIDIPYEKLLDYAKQLCRDEGIVLPEGKWSLAVSDRSWSVATNIPPSASLVVFDCRHNVVDG